ncbi:hypothetical protein J8F10_13190 [Gemmata sp. G18]|uniref:Uncharacterized protein n=1 Tax=Gemmata palustris TaxID=2822762 RepID=A0ABS5BR85_9BACT|nr:hypothetical protein [Gemmata palustris]MBP3956238.1 hypothetical protein [Gemmata palustris]
MLAFIVTLRSGRRYTIQAEELRSSSDSYIELLGPSTAVALPGVVALFDRADVVSVVAREHLVSEEPGDAIPHTVTRADPIPF